MCVFSCLRRPAERSFSLNRVSFFPLMKELVLSGSLWLALIFNWSLNLFGGLWVCRHMVSETWYLVFSFQVWKIKRTFTASQRSRYFISCFCLLFYVNEVCQSSVMMVCTADCGAVILWCFYGCLGHFDRSRSCKEVHVEWHSRSARLLLFSVWVTFPPQCFAVLLEACCDKSLSI